MQQGNRYALIEPTGKLSWLFRELPLRTQDESVSPYISSVSLPGPVLIEEIVKPFYGKACKDRGRKPVYDTLRITNRCLTRPGRGMAQRRGTGCNRRVRVPAARQFLLLAWRGLSSKSRLSHKNVLQERGSCCAKVAKILLFALILLGGPVATFAVESHRSTTSDAARQEAIKAIPLARVSPKHRQQVKRVVEHATLFRRLPTCVVDCHPGMFTYLALNPEVLVAIWRELGVTQIQLHRTGRNTFNMKDSSGTTGKIVLVEQQCDDQAQNRLVILAEGAYESNPLVRPVRARCVLVLRSGSVQETNGRHFVVARLDTFIHLDRTSVQMFAKMLHPLVGTTADRNFSDTINFVSNFSRTAEVRPKAVDQLASKITGVSTARRENLVQLAYQCQKDSRLQQSTRNETRELSQARLARFTEEAKLSIAH